MNNQIIENGVEYYINRLITQYRDKQKARQTIDAICRPLVELIPTLQFLENILNVDNAKYDWQYDLIGKIVGIDRSFIGNETFKNLIKFKIIINNTRFFQIDLEIALFYQYGNDIAIFSSNNNDLIYFVNRNILSSIQIAKEKKLLPIPQNIKKFLITDHCIPVIAFGENAIIDKVDNLYFTVMGDIGPIGAFLDISMIL
jgi:hypothetical protein